MNGLNAKWIMGACLLTLMTGCKSELDKVREEFIDNCKTGNASTEICECAIDRLQDHYGEKGLVAIKEQGVMPPDFMAQLARAGEGCRNEAQGLTQEGDINLAGCKVPGGLTPGDAEQIRCSSVDLTVDAAPGLLEPAAGVSSDLDMAAAAAAAAAAQAASTAEATYAANAAANQGASLGQAGDDARVISAAIAVQASQGGGSEYKEGRRLVEGDLNGDGVLDVAVLYTLEGAGGSMTSISYLAAFLREGSQLRESDTEILSGAAEALALKDGMAHVRLLSHGPDDPRCCPSIREDAAFVIHGNKWLQVRL